MGCYNTQTVTGDILEI